MRLPAMKGVIERRMLINFRADPAAVAKLLPPPFEPTVVRGHAIVGICLIRLGEIRPAFLPGACGIRSENAAHRFAVHWRDGGRQREGVYIPRRDTSSRLNALAGGRLFPGVHQRAAFRVVESHPSYELEMNSDDAKGSVHVCARATTEWPSTSVFETVDEASAFFRAGSLGYSATHRSGAFDGLELRCDRWQAEPLTVDATRSSYFENSGLFPPGSVEFDCGLLMRDISHEWRGRGQLCCPVAVGAAE